MEFLSYIQKYAQRENLQKKDFQPVSINLITNFTDEVLEKVLGGICLEHRQYPSITRAPYKQYHLLLGDTGSQLSQNKPDITFVFFDINPYRQGEFNVPGHIEEMLAGLASYCTAVHTTVVVSLTPLPYQSPYGHFFEHDPQFKLARAWNEGVVKLAQQTPNIYVFDTNTILHRLGEDRARDMRGTYAFDIPFSNDFFMELAAEWHACIRAITGHVRKCIVLDLDNTLWGGVVGEAGPLGISLGPDYPGIAFVNFQRMLLKLRDQGVLLAINSKNNPADVDEVFEKNPYMVLTKEHFAAIRTNWEDKSANIESIARELNIGTASMVFIDDSPLERERMQETHPEVLVPAFSLAPESYIETLLTLRAFHQMSQTKEDARRSDMYREEEERKAVKTKSKSKEEYLRELEVRMHVLEGEENDIPRVAQLTQKTNQFNLTTKRYSEAQITSLLKEGWQVYSADVTDKFGGYGVVIVAIIEKSGAEATLDTYLMSCRVMGRDVEFTFLKDICERLRAQGITTLHATFAATPKNAPAKEFLEAAGFTRITEDAGTEQYLLTLPA